MNPLRAVVTVPLAALLVLIGARFAWLLVGADHQSEMVDWVYHHSELWVRPFNNVFELQNEAAPGGGTVEFASLVAFAAYLTFGAFVTSLASRLMTRVP